jgi:glycosyltransferase involved in cell wall biosynthesis
LVIFNYYTESFAWQAIRKRAATQKPWVFWGERPGFLQLGRPARWFRRVALNRLHGGRAPIWAVGRFGIEGYQREFGDHRTYQNVPYYSNLERFSHRSRQTNSRRVILFSGSLIERKGVDLLASAFSKVADECRNLHLRFMGAGDLAESLQSELIKHAGRVEWLGFQPWDRLPEHYAAADLFCMPSRYDGWGLALVEALASGLPSISTTMTGAALELVENGKNGWLIPGEDEQALVNALREASRLSDPELQSMQEAARNSVVNHTLSRGADHFIHCAKEAIKHWQIHPSGNQSAH